MLNLLLAGADPDRAALLEWRLRALADVAVSRVPADRPLHDAVAAGSPDAIVVDLARPDRGRLDELCLTLAATPLPVVLFVDRDDRGFMEAAIAAGISSYNVAERGFPDLEPILGAAIAFFRQRQRVAADLHKAQTVLIERDTINRAKTVLMKSRNIAEPQAYRWMRRRAMNENKRIGEIAAAVLAAAGKDGAAS